MLDVIVDLRVGSPSLRTLDRRRTHRGQRMRGPHLRGTRSRLYRADRRRQSFLPMLDFYDPHRRRGVHPLDAQIGIEWPLDTAPILSDKDQAAPSLSAAQASLMLPDYARCRGLCQLACPFLRTPTASARLAAAPAASRRSARPAGRGSGRDRARSRPGAAPGGVGLAGRRADPLRVGARATRKRTWPARTRSSGRRWSRGRCRARRPRPA